MLWWSYEEIKKMRAQRKREQEIYDNARREEGREEEKKLRDAVWEAWVQKKIEADHRGEEFNVPMPSQVT